jgi:opacity protein-like surface antigen
MRRFGFALLLVLAAGSLAAAETPQAAGKFSGKKWEFETSGAYAFPAKVGMDDEPGIRVAVSNSRFNAEIIDRFWDREFVIDNRFADEQTLVAYFHFAKDGTYKGMSYSFGSGDGCGFCYDGKVRSTVKIAGGRLKGKVALAPQPDENSWDIDLDVPVAPSDYGTPLPAGGGEPGAVYATYHKAIVDNDTATLGKVFKQGIAAKLAEHPDEVARAWREDHPTESYKVTKGFVRGDHALLLVDGATSYSKVEVEAHLVKEGAAWKIDDEVLQVKLGGD